MGSPIRFTPAVLVHPVLSLFGLFFDMRCELKPPLNVDLDELVHVLLVLLV